MKPSLFVRGLMIAAAIAASCGTALAEASSLRVAKQYGLGYLQLMLMEDQKLVEKQAKARGLGDVQVEWSTFRSSDVMNDALISGNVDFVCLGLVGLATIWSRTRGNIDVRAVAGLNAVPWFLNVRDPNVKSLADFKPSHKIALPAAKVSIQAVLLQMAAAKELGQDKYASLDPLTVSLAHPEAMAAMLGGKSEIIANFSSPPFQYRQLKDPNIHKLLDTTQLLPEGLSFNVIATRGKFRTENPQLYAAFLAAFDEATALINADKRKAAEDYLRISKDKSPIEEMMEIMNDPNVHFTGKPINIPVVVDFMAKTGQIKGAPSDWKEMFFPEGLERKG